MTTTKDKAPKYFTELTDAEYDACCSYYKTGEKMMEPYTEAGEYINAALRYAAANAAQSLN